MMMIETVKHGSIQHAIPDFEVMKKFMEDDSEVKIRKQEIIGTREIHSLEDKRDPELRKRFVRPPLSGRRSKHMNLDEIHRMPSLFTWRC